MKKTIDSQIIRDVEKAWFSDTKRAGLASARTAPYRKFGFTLAEVLITLGVIGVVAALTLPTLIEKHQKKVTTTRLKAAYSILSQALLMAQKDYDEPKYWTNSYGQNSSNQYNSTVEWVDKYLLPYIDGAKVPGWKSLADVGYKTAYVTLNGKTIPNGNFTSLGDGAYLIELKNQTLILINHDSDTNADGEVFLTNILFYTDINGKQKPNMWGRDMFLFLFNTSNGTLQLYGNVNSREELISNQCTKNTEWGNIMCGAVIMKDGWEIKDDYPW